MERPQFRGAAAQILVATVNEHLATMNQSGVTSSASRNSATSLRPHLPPRVGLEAWRILR